MNKIQYIKLLNLRGITELKGMTIASAVRDTGGDPTDAEMATVNEQAMNHYIQKYQETEKARETLDRLNTELQEESDWLRCLEAAGVDNWEGYEIAQDMRDGTE
jgi:hypothetical protein